jgi:phage terminase small subunit
MALTHKQETFCQGIIDGLTQSEAYQRAYDAENMSAPVIANKASELMLKGEIRVRIDALKQQLDELNILPRATRLKVLAEIATRNARKLTDKDRIKTARDNDVIAAIKAYGEMVGDNAPQKLAIEHSGTIDTVKTLADFYKENKNI